MPKCPQCETRLEELIEITGYHYWMCPNSHCQISYKFNRNAAQQSVQADEAAGCAHRAPRVIGENSMFCDDCGKTLRR